MIFGHFTERHHNASFAQPFCICTCVSIHPGRVEPAPPFKLTTSRTKAPQVRRSYASPPETFTQSFLHRELSNTRGPVRGSRSALFVVAHVFSWPPVRLRHVRGGVGKSGSLINSPPGRLAAWPNQWNLLWTICVVILMRRRRWYAISAPQG